MKSIIVALAALPLLAFGETITLDVNDAWNKAQSFTLAETVSTYGTFPSGWSDAKAPHADADYLVEATEATYRYLMTMGQKPEYNMKGYTFGGKSLTLRGYSASKPTQFYIWISGGQYSYQYPITINDFILDPWAELQLENTSKYGADLYGKMTVNGTKSGPVQLTGRLEGSYFNIHSTLVGDANAHMRLITSFGQLTNEYGDVKSDARTRLSLLGDTTAYLGTVELWQHGELSLGDYGLAKGKVLFSSSMCTLSSESAKLAAVKELDASAGGILKLSHPATFSFEKLTLGAGTRIDMNEFADDKSLKSAITVTGELAQDGVVGVDISMPCDIEKVAILTTTGKAPNADDFYLVNPEDSALKVEENTLWVVNTSSEYFDSTGYVKLIKNDPKDTTLERHNYSYHYAAGWENGLWPEDTNDYFVASGWLMNLINHDNTANGHILENISTERTGNSGAYWKNVKFYGRSLTVAGTLCNKSPSDMTGYSLSIADLRMLSGSKIDFSASENDTIFNWRRDGNKLTVLATEKNPLVITGRKNAAKTFYCYNRLVGESNAFMKLEGGSGAFAFASVEGKGINYYYGTISVGANLALYLEDAGYFNGTVSLEAPSATFAFATYDTVSADNYAARTERTSGEFRLHGFRAAKDFTWDTEGKDFEVDELTVGGTLTIAGGGKVTFPAKGAWSVGALGSDIVFDCSGVSGRLSLETGLDLGSANGGKVTFDFTGARVPVSVEKFRVVSLPASADTKAISVVGLPASCELSYETVGTRKTLVATNKSYFPIGEDYVLLTRDDLDWYSGKASEFSYHLAGGWDDGLMPTKDKDYFVPAGTKINLLANTSAAIESEAAHGSLDPEHSYWMHVRFYGGSLTLAGTAFNNCTTDMEGFALSIPDWRVLSGSNLQLAGGNITYFDVARNGCKLTVEAFADDPFVIGGGEEDHETYFYQKLIGGEDSGIRITNAVPTSVSFLGDLSEYYGEIAVGAGELLELGSGYPGTLKLESSSSDVMFTVEEGTVLTFRKLTTSGLARLEVPDGCCLWFEESELNGTLDIVCEDYHDGQVVIGKRSGEGIVRLNGVAVGEDEIAENGAIYFYGLDGDGTEYNQYYIDDLYKLGFLHGDVASFADNYYYFTEDAMPKTAYGQAPLFYLDTAAEIDPDKLVIDTSFDGYDQYALATKKVGGRKQVVLKTILIDDVNYDNIAKLYEHGFIYTWATADEGNTAEGNIHSSFGDYPDDTELDTAWREPFAAETPTKLKPVAGHDYVIFPAMYRDSSGVVNSWGSMVKIRGGELEPFAGDSLTICSKGKLRDDYNASVVTIDDLRVQNGSRWLACGLLRKSQTLRGKLTVLSTAEDPFLIQTQVTNNMVHTMVIESRLIGGYNRYIKIDNDREGDTFGTTEVDFTGNCDGFYGTVDAGKGGIVGIGGEVGLANASVIVGDEGVGVVACTPDGVSMVNSLTIAAGKTIWVRGGEGLAVMGSYVAQGVVTLDLGQAKFHPGMNMVFMVPEPISGEDLNIVGAPAEGKMEFDGMNLVITMPDVPEVKVMPGEEAKNLVAGSEAEAADMVKITVPAEVAAAGVDEAGYVALFAKAVTKNADGTYNVKVVLASAVEAEIADEVAAAETEILAKPGEGGEVVLATKPGLYYSLDSGAELGGMNEGKRTLATGAELPIEVPAIEGAKGFYSIRVNVTAE